MRREKTFADLSPREVLHIHYDCGRDRPLMPITLLSEGTVRGKTTMHSLKHRLRCRGCRKRPSTVFVDKRKD
jgi:hypothetical protein